MPKVSGGRLSRITLGMVRLHRDYYGKGPIEAKTFSVNDTIICILKGGFTTVEETLLAAGDGEEVSRLRRRFQDRMKDLFVAVIEETIDRKVATYMSQVDASEQVSVEIFLLEPQGPHDEQMIGEHVAKFDESGNPSE